MEEQRESISWDDVPAFLDELKEMARALLRRESSAQSIQTTALVLSALRRQKREEQEWREVGWEDRDELFRLAHRSMRQALIDHARTRRARRGRLPVERLAGDVTLDDLVRSTETEPERVECLVHALDDLEEAQPTLARVVQHTMYTQLSIPEIARLAGESDRTVRDRFQRARAWIARRMKETCPELG